MNTTWQQWGNQPLNINRRQNKIHSQIRNSKILQALFCIPDQSRFDTDTEFLFGFLMMHISFNYFCFSELWPWCMRWNGFLFKMCVVSRSVQYRYFVNVCCTRLSIIQSCLARVHVELRHRVVQMAGLPRHQKWPGNISSWNVTASPSSNTPIPHWSDRENGIGDRTREKKEQERGIV